MVRVKISQNLSAMSLEDLSAMSLEDLPAISLADLPARKKQVNLPEGWQMNFEQKWVVYDLRV